MTLILSEEVWGPIPAADLPFVLFVNAPWAIFPLIILYRFATNEHPFTRVVDAEA